MKPVRVLAVTAVAAASLLAFAPAMPALAAAPGAEVTGVESDFSGRQCRVVTFESADVVPDDGTTGPVDGPNRRLTLVVSGTRWSTNVAITLVPVVYVRQPEYWAIEVVGCSSGIGLPVLTSYTVKLDVTNTVGTVGIDVVGSDRSLQIPVFPVPA